MKRWQSASLWILSLLLTASLGIYQRWNGPTYPLKGKETIGGERVSYRFLRSQTSGESLPVVVEAPSPSQTAILQYRRYPTQAPWTSVSMAREGTRLRANVPSQPAAGKVEYRVVLIAGQGESILVHGQPIVARFKNRVPAVLLAIHILFMFGALLLGIRSGLEALRRQGRWNRLVAITFVVTAIGGLLLGPIVQKLAFGQYWTGFPLGKDLTDSKTLAVVLLWLVAFMGRKRSRWWILLALVLMVAVYLIPHSLFGSELDYRTGRVITG